MYRIFILLFYFFPLTLQAGYHSGKLQLTKELDSYSLGMETDYRYDETGLYYRHYDFGVEKDLGNDWSLSVNYRAIYQDDGNKWQLEKRPHAQIQKLLKFEPVKVQLRTRLEYRYKSNDTESARNRSRIMLKSNYAILAVKPFVSNEVFYDMDAEKYNKNWLSSGVELANNSYGKYSIYYKHVTDLNSNDDWESSYSIVFKAGYQF